MRYLYLLFFAFLSLHSHFVFSQAQTVPLQCAENSLAGSWCALPAESSYLQTACDTYTTSTSSAYLIPYGDGGSCSGQQKRYGCFKSCSCPEGYKLNTVVSGATRDTHCVLDEPIDLPDECDAGQVFYMDFCRDSVPEPPECGNTYVTAVFVDGRYVCTQDEGCGDGIEVTIVTTPAGSWKVCGSGDGDNPDPNTGSSSPTASSLPTANSSTPSTGGGDDNGSGTGTGGGTGTGDGSGSGHGSAASSSTPSGGSGSASSGIGNGGEADASKCENGEPHCDGDPIQCAILIQLWINNCAGYDDVETNNPDDDNEAIQSNFDALISSAEPSVNAEGVLTAMTPGGGNGNGTGNGSGSGTGSGHGNGDGLDLSGLGDAANSGGGGTCPPDRSIRLGLGTFNVSFGFLCDFASQISGLILLIFSYIGAMIVYRSLNW
jgi:hypothetical protein